MTHVLQLFVTTLLVELRVQISNDDVNVKFDEKKLIGIFIATFFDNTLHKIVIATSSQKKGKERTAFIQKVESQMN
jgi:hypothetical protein